MRERYEEQRKDDPNSSVGARRCSSTCLHWCSVNTEREVVWRVLAGTVRTWELS